MSHENSGPHWAAQGQTSENLKIVDNVIHISAKALNIIWGNDSRFWQWTRLHDGESKFSHGAELLQVNWIEVTGKFDYSHLKEYATYEIIYVVKFKVDAFGWHSSPVKFKLTTTDGQTTEITEILEPYRKMSDKWHHIRGGEFKVQSKQGEVHFGMYETGTDWWKGSMILEEVRIKLKA